MRATLVPGLAVPVLLALQACTPPDVPTPEDAAAYLGLSVGEKIAFTSAPLSAEAEIEVKASSVLRDGALVFDLVSKESGFVKDDRTFTLSVGVDDTSLVRFADCIQTCAQPESDIPFLTLPLDSGDTAETDVDVTITTNGAEGSVVAEKHTVIVGAEEEVTVPAGTFTAFTVSWTRTRDAIPQASILTIAPDVGIVAWQTFDGAQLERK